MTLKTRAVGQMSVKELVARDFKAELLAKEAKHFKRKLPASAGGHLTPIGDGDEPRGAGERAEVADDATVAGDAGPSGSDRVFEPKRVDADDSDDDDDDDDDDSDSEDDTAALLAELERIKKERADAAARREADDAENDALEKAEALASGNPLLDLKPGEKNGGGGFDDDDAFVAKRRWDDDVVFKNQTRGEPKTKKRFVNDTIRSDFHRRFLNKYVK
jgi:protein CWC15